MTFAEQRDMIWAGLGTTSSAETDLVTGDNLSDWLDTWEYEIVKQVIGTLPRDRWAYYLDDLVSTDTNTGNGSTRRWNLPADYFPGGNYLLTVNSIPAVLKGSDYERAIQTNTLMASSALDPVYYIFNSQYILGHAPANSLSVVFYYIKNPLGTAGGSSSLLPAKLHQTGVWYCLREAFTIDGDDVQAAQFNEKYLNESRALIT